MKNKMKKDRVYSHNTYPPSTTLHPQTTSAFKHKPTATYASFRLIAHCGSLCCILGHYFPVTTVMHFAITIGSTSYSYFGS